MQMHHKFMVDMVALTGEMNRTSGDAKDGMVPIDARLFNILVREAAKVQGVFNKDLNFKTSEAIRRLESRFKQPTAPRPKEEGSDGNTDLQQSGQSAPA
jgi:hypothetical protein